MGTRHLLVVLGYLSVFAVLLGASSTTSLVAARERLTAVPSTAAVNDPLNPIGLQYLGSTGGAITTVKVNGITAYVGEGEALTILNVANPAAPVRLSYTYLSAFVHDIEVVGTLLYVIADDLYIFDVSDPSQPALRGSYVTPNWLTDVEVVGTVAYVTEHNKGLLIFDMSNPSQPILRGLYKMVMPFVVEVVGTRAYVSAVGYLSQYLLILDVSDASAPHLLSGYFAGYRISIDEIEIAGNYVFFSISSGHPYNSRELRVLDVSAPTQPVLVTTYTPDSQIKAIGIQSGLTYLLTDKLQVFDFSNPQSPQPIGAYDPSTETFDVQVVGTLAYIGTSVGLIIVDVSQPSTPTLLGKYATLGTVSEMQLLNSHLYVATGAEGLSIVDVQNPAVPTVRGRLDTPGYAYAVDVEGSLGAVADGEAGVVLVDVSNAAQPVQRSRYDTPGTAYDVKLIGTRAYVADNTALLVLDVSDAAAPQLLATLPLPAGASQVEVAGTRAYVRHNEGIAIISLATPAAPTLLGTLARQSIKDIEVVDSRLYAIDAFSLYAYDVANAAAPTELDSLDVSWSESQKDLEIAGSRAFIVGYAVDVVDIREPTDLQLRQILPEDGSVVKVQGDLVYVGSKYFYQTALRIFRTVELDQHVFLPLVSQ